MNYIAAEDVSGYEIAVLVLSLSIACAIIECSVSGRWPWKKD